MEDLSFALRILSAIITPAVLILACSSLIVATSARLGRVVDRTRKLSDDFVALAHDESDDVFLEEHQALLFDQTDKATRRARLLQRAMTRLYLGLSAFLGDSVAIGVVAATGREYGWVVIGLAFAGVGLLFWASVLLIVESRLALSAIDAEMDFVRRLGEHHASSDLLEGRRVRRRFFRGG